MKRRPRDRAHVGVDARPPPIYPGGMSGDVAAELSRYVRFDAGEAARVAELRPIVSPHFADVAEAFYERTRDFHDAHAVFEDEAQIERLKTSLVAWMTQLFSGTYDDAFFAHAARMGLAHVRVGLPQRYMLSATSVLRMAFGAIVDRASGGSYVRHLRALDQLLDLSLAVMLESYATATLERVLRDARREAQARRNERLAAVGTLAAGLAHEIRNPLNGALLNLKIIDRELGGGRPEIATMQDAAALMRHEIVRLSRLTTEFLDFARPHEIDAVDVDLGTVARRAAQQVASDAADADVAMHVDAPHAPVVVSGDASKLEQVARNLLRNAIEAVAPAGGVLCARVREEADGGSLEVEDDGPGVLEGAPIFDAFYSTKAASTGLGLAVAHRIVIAHGGSIDFDSRPGRTIFRISVPSRRSIDRSSP